jgi:hypothetical protein
LIKKLRNQPYAPKMGASPQAGARGSKKNMYWRKVSDWLESSNVAGDTAALWEAVELHVGYVSFRNRLFIII